MERGMLINLPFAGFVVNGTAIPDITFDIGESFAGLLPISEEHNETRQLYFWFVAFFMKIRYFKDLLLIRFFPSDNANATDEITIW
jgi:carboxypeptidase D